MATNSSTPLRLTISQILCCAIFALAVFAVTNAFAATCDGDNCKLTSDGQWKSFNLMQNSWASCLDQSTGADITQCPAYVMGITSPCYQIKVGNSATAAAPSFIPMGSAAEFNSFLHSSFAADQANALSFQACPNTGACGSANGQQFADLASLTAAQTCTTSAVAAPSGSGPWSWTCRSTVQGYPALACSATAPGLPAPVNGLCGTAKGVAVSAAPSTNLCSTGTASIVAGSGPWTWSCNGSNGGSNDTSCQAPVIPTCTWLLASNDSWKSFSSFAKLMSLAIPEAYACTPTSSCTDYTAGTTCAQGSADYNCLETMCPASHQIHLVCNCGGAINGTCGTASGIAVSAAPSTNLCSTGTASIVAGSGPWTWSCNGSNGGSNASCGAFVAQSPLCMCMCQDYFLSSNVPTSALYTVSSNVVGCSAWSGFTDGVCGNQAPYGQTWAHGSTSESCTPNSNPVTGTCGSANGIAASTAPTANLCTTGTASSVAGAGPWTWSCNGSNGGSNASCQAAVASTPGSCVDGWVAMPNANGLQDATICSTGVGSTMGGTACPAGFYTTGEMSTCDSTPVQRCVQCGAGSIPGVSCLTNTSCTPPWCASDPPTQTAASCTSNGQVLESFNASCCCQNTGSGAGFWNHQVVCNSNGSGGFSLSDRCTSAGSGQPTCHAN